MDMKAAARSKRAQSQKAKSKHTAKHPNSQHQKKNEPNQAQQPQEENAPRPQSEKPSRKTLPSNWDRYEEDVHSSEEEGKHVPKEEETLPVQSKGADYAYLLSQAQEQGGFDAQMPEYAERISSMLYVRGRNLLNWADDDNFIVKDDNTTAEYKASFLSLDLWGLASQLAKLERPKRLFIEKDKLPAELCSENCEAEEHQIGDEQWQVDSNRNKSRTFSQLGKHQPGEEQKHTCSNQYELTIPKVEPYKESYIQSFSFPGNEKSSETAKLKDHDDKSMLSTVGKNFPEAPDQGVVHTHGEASTLPFSTSLESQMRVGTPLYKANSVENVDRTSGNEFRQSNRSSLKIYQESNEIARYNDEAGTAKFEASAAEAELDALLDTLDKPSNIGVSEEQGTISDPFSKENSLYKEKQPFQDQLQGPFNLISRNNKNMDDLLSKSAEGRHEEDKAKTKYGSVSVAASVLPPESSTSVHKDATKVFEDDFDKWLDTI